MGKRGPKPKPPEEAKSKHITFRLRDGFHERLKASALEAGRSMSEELELRVRQSFDAPDIADRVAALVAERLAR